MTFDKNTIGPRYCLRIAALIIVVLWSAVSAIPAVHAADSVKIGLLKIGTSGFIYLAQKRGYFAEEGLDVELVYMGSAQTIAVATVSGGVDFGVSAISAGFYNLAGQGALKIIGGYASEARGFPSTAWVLSKQAHASGLRTYKDLPGRSVAVSAVGSAAHYEIGLVTEKYGLNLSSIRVVPMQTQANATTAVIGGQVDAGVIPGSFVEPALQNGSLILMGHVSDETPHELGVTYTNAKTANERQNVVERYLRAYRKATKDYHDAFTGPNGKKQNGPTAPAVLVLLAEQVDQPPASVAGSLGYVERDAKVDVPDLLNQIRWFKSLGMVRPEIDGETIIDRRYVIERGKP